MIKLISSLLLILLSANCSATVLEIDTNRNRINFEKMDTVQTKNLVQIRSLFSFDYGTLYMINSFKRDTFTRENCLFNLKSYLGFSIKYKNHIYKDIKGLNEEDEYCENIFSVFKGDTVDNIEGYNPLIFNKDSIRIFVLEGYPFECNGSYCNAGSILILKFINNDLQKIYLFGIDKTVHSLSNMNGEILSKDCFLLQLHFQNKLLNLLFNENVKVMNNEKNINELGLYCINLNSD